LRASAMLVAQSGNPNRAGLLSYLPNTT